jgi:hypothetical protein
VRTRTGRVFFIKSQKQNGQRFFKEEVNKEKTKRKPQATEADRRASKRYKSNRLTWGQTLKKAGAVNVGKKYHQMYSYV